MIVTMIAYCPTAHGMDLGYAYNQLMDRLSDDDWACFIDHDACFTTRDWYAQLERIVAAHPEPCVLTCRTNRVGSAWQRVAEVDPDNHLMQYHRDVGRQLADRYGDRLADATADSLMSGVVILLSKRTWQLLGGFSSGFLGVDNRLHAKARECGAPVYLMEGVYVYHWYRAAASERSEDPSVPQPLMLQSASTLRAPRLQEPSARTEDQKPSTHSLAAVIAGLVPETAHRVALPQGAEALIAELRMRPEIELLPKSAEELLNGCRANVEDSARDPADSGPVDCLVCGDLLTRTRDAEALLHQFACRLQPGGSLVAVIPNVGQRRVIEGLLAGTWSSGDNFNGAVNQLRFMTRRELEKLCFRTGLELDACEPLSDPVSASLNGSGLTGTLPTEGLSPRLIEMLATSKYVVRAKVVARPRYELTSIVLVTHNELGYTHGCLESIRARTDLPYELIVVDNGSTDGTVEYLSGQSDVRLVANKVNRGFPAAANQGIEAARGQQILLLNNDTLVTTGWLERMLDALHADPQIGLVGPCSNAVSGPQQVTAGYSDLASLDGFAWEWGKDHAGQTEACDRLVGFCLLIRRPVVDSIGLLDERFGIGNFEDDDYCLRAAQAGYRAVIARAAYVHHFGHVTFRAAGIDLNNLLRQNEQLFHEKWRTNGSSHGRPLAAASAATTFPAPPPVLAISRADSDGLRLELRQLRLSLALIARNNENTIRPCLESIRPWVDEMVVVDTGSTDKTPEIARELGARVFHFPWCDNFSAARNESLRHARGEWLFWMDSDDTIDSFNGKKLRQLADGLEATSPLGHVIQVHCPGAGADGLLDVTAVDHVKLIRNRPDLRFEFRVHEQILPAIRRANGEVGWTDIFVVHSGSDHSPEGRRRKQERDLRILKLDLAEHPDHPFVLFNLGMTYADMDRYDTAVEFLKRCVNVSGPDESHLRKAYALLIGSLMQIDRLTEADEVCRAGQQLFSDDAELWFRRGILEHRLGRLSEAVKAYRHALANRGERHFSSIDRGIVGFKARHNLALVFEDADNWLEAEEQWRLIVSEVPNYRDGWRGLADNLLKQQKFAAVQEIANRLASDRRLAAEAKRIEGQLYQVGGDWSAARRALDEAVRAEPDDLVLVRTRCQFLFERGTLDDAEQALKELAERDHADCSARHNLGTICLRKGRADEAADYYRQSIELGSRTPESHLYLAFALEQLGQVPEAIRACQTLLAKQPSHAQAAEVLARLQASNHSSLVSV